MILATDANFFSNAMRSIFGLLDGLVYWLLVQIYNLFTTIASVDLFTKEAVGTFADRIYALLGVVVLFRLTISVFTYILDPDKMSDSKTGFGSLIKNVIVMLVILTLTPFIFDKAMALQRTVLKENTISKIIVGKTSASTKSFGDALAKDTLISFVEPSDVASSENEKALYDMIDDPNATYKDVLKLATDNKKKESGQYIYDYRYLVSTIVGGFMVYIFLIFSIDIAVRTVKLGFLKLIAPLPIVTYVDPKGRDLFNKWLKQCTSTYLDLFIRLAGIFFAQYLVTLIMDVDEWKKMTTTTGENPNFLVKVFIILGCLMFAKQLPEILKGLGLNVGGKFELNPFKKAASIPLAGGALAAGMQLAGNTALAGGRMATSGIRGINRGVVSAARGQGFGAGFVNSFNADTGRAVARLRSGVSAAGGTWSNWKGDGKYESGGAKYKSMMHGKDATSAVLGKQLFDRFGDLSKTDYQSRYTDLLHNKDMARVAGNLDAAKDRRNALQSEYEQKQLNFEKGIGNLTAAEVDAARIAATKASSDYDKISAEFSRIKSENVRDAERYDAYMKYSDAYQAQDRVAKYNPESASTSTASSSGIILPGDPNFKI